MPAVGDLVRTTDDRWMILRPQHCPAGHRLIPGRMIVAHRPCAEHSGHQTWTCPCGQTVAAPAVTAACDPQGPAAVREL